MTSSKSTKRALVSSALAIFMCVTMLIGTTFAWFTDTASTAVNKIQAGTLNVDIVDKNGDSLDGKSLSFKDVNNNTDILWEPGATFNLDSFKIVNKGNLAFKYKVIISGVNGNAKLLEAIDFFVKIGDAQQVALADRACTLLPAGKTATTGNEVVGATYLITISGTMKKEAGNEYQGLSIDGIGITVVATQYTYEYDSNNNTYDENANGSVILANPANVQNYLDGEFGSIDGKTIILSAGNYGKLELGRATKYRGSNTDYYIGGVSEANKKTYDEFVTIKNNGQWSASAYYVRNMSNVTLKAAQGATVTVAGLTGGWGHVSGECYDYVLEPA